MTCPVCHGSGDASGQYLYDCAAPGCTAAVDRANLDAGLKLLPPMIKEDVHWAAYKAGEQIAEQRWALERAELIQQLRNMWGLAIELNHGGDFFSGDEDTAAALDEWQFDTRQALALLQTYKDAKCKS